ncbi:phage tail tape measure protein [Blastochloris sulfoviridis]|nr:phage tail tape measure protein [Blastochloris sulfoviridis]
MDDDDFAAADLREATATLADARDQMADLSAAARSFGSAISTAMKAATTEGKAFDDVLKTLGLRLLKIGADAAGKLIASNLAGLTQGALAASSLGEVTAFAKGGVVGAPSLFAMQGGLGLMGESGTEAIVPLARGADGRLGVRADTNGAAPASVVVNVTTADVASFRRSEAHIASLLARAVARGQRTL